MNRDDMIRRVVENALDFLDRAISDIRTRPKHSIINFYSAVELVLKARLMAEHWSLIVAKGNEADRASFEAGDFQSVTLDLAVQRLDKVVDDGLQKEEVRAFDEVRKHRNRVVHFFHGGLSGAEAVKQQHSVARQQLSAWYHLQTLLTKRWESIFREWRPQIDRIDTRLRKLRAYLKVVFEQVRPAIDEGKKVGAVFAKCRICKYPAVEDRDELGVVGRVTCLVCENADSWLKIMCENCLEIVHFKGDGFVDCRCGQTFGPEDLVEVLSGGEPEKDSEWERGHCGDCYSFETVVKTKRGNFVCTQCLGMFDEVTRCGWCNVPNTGELIDSTWTGCSFCAGHSGHLAGKDD